MHSETNLLFLFRHEVKVHKQIHTESKTNNHVCLYMHLYEQMACYINRFVQNQHLKQNGEEEEVVSNHFALMHSFSHVVVTTAE